MQRRRQPNLPQMRQTLGPQSTSPQQTLMRYRGPQQQAQPLQYASPQQVEVPQSTTQTAPSIQDAQGVQSLRQAGVMTGTPAPVTQPVRAAGPNRMEELLQDYVNRTDTTNPTYQELQRRMQLGATQQPQQQEMPQDALGEPAETPTDPAMLGVSSEERFQNILTDLQGSWQETQNQLARQAAADQRRASAINAAMGRNIGGGFAGLSAQAGLAAGQNLSAARQAHNAQVRDAQMQWLDRVFQREEAARARGHQLDVIAAQTGEGLAGEAGTGIAGEGEVIEGGAIPTDVTTGEAIPHFEDGITEFNIEYPEGDRIGRGIRENDGYNDNWEWWFHAGEGGNWDTGKTVVFPRGVSQEQIKALRDSGGKGGNVKSQFRGFRGVRNHFGGKVPAIFALNHGGGQDIERGDFKNAARAIEETLGSYGIDENNWYFDIQPETGLWEVKDEFGKDIGVFSSDGRLVQANPKWDQQEYQDRVGESYAAERRQIENIINTQIPAYLRPAMQANPEIAREILAEYPQYRAYVWYV